MALPTYINSGTVANLSAAGTVALPASIQVNDILLLVIETANEAVVISNAAGGTWTQFPNSPQGTGTAAGLTATRLTVFWSRYNGTQTAPTISDSGDHQIAQIMAFRGCKTTGDPFNITSGNVDTASDTSLSATGAVTTVPDCLVCILATLMDDGQNFGATWTNPDLANILVRSNFSGTAGNDGRGILVTGQKATAGTYGPTTNTLTASSVKAMMTIALEPPPSGYTLACDPVAVAVTVAAVSLLKASVLAAAAVSVAITPAPTTLLKGSRLAADPPAVSVTPADATLTYTPSVGYTLNCEPVSVGVTIADASLRAGRRLATDPVSVAITPTEASVRATRLLTAAPVAVTVTPAAAGVLYGRKVLADPVAVALTIGQASLVYEPATGYVLACDPVAVALTPAALTLVRGYAIQAAPVAVLLTIADATIAKSVFARAGATRVVPVSLVTRKTVPLTLRRRHGSSIMDTYRTSNGNIRTSDSAPRTSKGPMGSV